MKIYNKKGFAMGMVLGLLGLAILAVSLWRGFDGKGMVLMAACLLLAVPFLLRSFSPAMSREDKLTELDERTQLIKRRSESTALTLSQWLCLACLIASRFTVGVMGEKGAAGLTLAFGVMYVIMFVCELAAWMVYERKL